MWWLIDLLVMAYENLLLIIFCIICLFRFLDYVWSRRRIYKLSLKLPGPLALPLIGCCYKFLFVESTDVFKIIKDILDRFKSGLVAFWMGPDLFVLVKTPEQAEKVFVSTKLSTKSKMYDVLKSFVGDGMISGSGVQWKVARKWCQPLFGQNFVSGSIGISNKHINRFMETLMDKVGEDQFDLVPITHYCVSDIIGESILGTDLGVQKGQNRDFINALEKVYDLLYTRMVKPWYTVDFVYNNSNIKKQQDEYKQICDLVMEKAVDKVRKTRKNGGQIVINGFKPAINDLDQVFMENSKELDYRNYLDNLLTLFMASEDTVAHIASAACFCLGMYPACQEKCAMEIARAVGRSTTNLTYDDVAKLEYLDQCVKETLRLFPIAPFIARKVIEDFQIDDVTLPPDVTVMTSIFSLHFDRKQWLKPMEFRPEHFDAPEIEKRHPYAFVPFSSGPRGCIGKLYAYTSIKAEGKYEDIYKELYADISVRSKIGFPVKLSSRQWRNE